MAEWWGWLGITQPHHYSSACFPPSAILLVEISEVFPALVRPLLSEGDRAALL